MKELSSFFTVVIQSFYSKVLYHDIALRWTTKRALIYLFICQFISEVISQTIHFLHITDFKYPMILFLTGIMTTIIMSLYGYIFLITASLLFGLIGILSGKYLNINLSYQQYLRIALTAFIPSIIIFILIYFLILIFSSFKGFSSIYFYFFYAIAFCYFVYGSSALRAKREGGND